MTERDDGATAPGPLAELLKVPLPAERWPDVAAYLSEVQAVVGELPEFDPASESPAAGFDPRWPEEGA